MNLCLVLHGTDPIYVSFTGISAFDFQKYPILENNVCGCTFSCLFLDAVQQIVYSSIP